MDNIKITGNYLKMLSKSFLHLVPVKHMQLVQGGKYNVLCDVYGGMGTVEVVTMWSCALYDLKPTVMLMANGETGAIDAFKAVGVFSTDMIQCCCLRFVRRSNNAFTALLEGELGKAGITLVSQPALF